MRVEHVDISALPLINTDLETDGGAGFPPAVEAFRDSVRQADCFLFGSPEFNYSIASTCSAPPPRSSCSIPFHYIHTYILVDVAQIGSSCCFTATAIFTMAKV